MIKPKHTHLPKSLVVASMVLAMTLSAVVASHPALAQSSRLTPDALANAEYPIQDASGRAPGGTYKLTDGKFEDTANQTTVQLSGPQASGDLNGDGIPDAAVTLVVNTSGSGVFSYLAAVLNEGGQAKPVDAVFLGDRIRVQRVTIDNEEIIVRFLDRRFDQPMSATPRIPVTQRYALEGDKLIAVSPLSAASLRNTTYLLEAAPDGQVFLINGRYEDSRNNITASLQVRPQASGDLNSDGSPDSAVILNANTGGSGAFSYLQAVLNNDYQPAVAAATLIGDRVRVTGLSINDGVITATYLDRKPDEPMSARPTVQTTKQFVLSGNKLVEPGSAEATAPQATAPTVPVPGAVPYTCADGKTMSASFTNNLAMVTFEGQTQTLTRQVTGDGIHYTNETWDLRGKGDQATLTDVKSGEVLASDCVAGQPAAEQPQAPEMPATVTALYACADDKTMNVVFDNTKREATVTFDGQTVVLPQQVSGSGIRYANDTYEFRGKGNDAMLTDLTTNQVVLADCKAAQTGDTASTSDLPAETNYVSDVLPAADASGRVITLTLSASSIATMTTQFIDKGAIVETGTWSQEGEVITANLTLANGKTDVLGFQVQGDQLALLNPVESGYGMVGLTLAKAGAPATGAATSETAMPEQETPPLTGVLTGTVTYLQRIALPPNAIVEVQLADVSRADAAATVVTSQTIETNGAQVPIPFELKYDPAAIDPRMTYAVSARITVDGQLQWINDTRYNVLTRGAPTTGVDILVAQVQQ